MIRTVLKYLFSAIFLFSAFAKLIDYNSTVELFKSLLLTDNITTKIFLAVLIIIEFAIAYLIIEDYVKQEFVFKTIIKLISVFLLINIIFAIKGYNNCGCFGSKIISSPLTSLIKNIVLIIGLYYLRQSNTIEQRKTRE